MKFVEDTEAAWSAEQLAAAEAEIEQQKREWELGRLQVLKEEADRHTRVTDDDEQLLTFSHEDAHNQVNNSTGPTNSDDSKRFVVGGSRRPRGSGRGRGRGRGRTRNHSGAHNYSASDSDASSCNDANATSSVDEEDEDSDEKDSSSGDESYIGGSRSNRSSASRKPTIPNNHRLTSPNSPRTRSRGTVSIDLWTLDVSPILPGVRPIGTSARRGGRRGRMRRGGGRGLRNFTRSPEMQSLSPRRLSSSSGHSVSHSSPPPVPYSNPNLVIRTRRASVTPLRHSDVNEIDMSESFSPKKGGRVSRVTRRSESSVEGNGPIS